MPYLRRTSAILTALLVFLILVYLFRLRFQQKLPAPITIANGNPPPSLPSCSNICTGCNSLNVVLSSSTNSIALGCYVPLSSCSKDLNRNFSTSDILIIDKISVSTCNTNLSGDFTIDLSNGMKYDITAADCPSSSSSSCPTGNGFCYTRTLTGTPYCKP